MRDRALSVEVRRRLVAIQIGEHRRECLSSFEHVGRLAAFAVHVDGEAGVGGEERLLTFGVAAVGAVGVGVEQLANRRRSAASAGVSRCGLAIDGSFWRTVGSGRDGAGTGVSRTLSIAHAGRFVKDRVIGLEDVRHPRGDVERDLDVGGGGLLREADWRRRGEPREFRPG